MPNTPVQATAEGLPALSRRRLLQGTLAGAFLATLAEKAEAMTPERRRACAEAELTAALEAMFPGAEMRIVRYDDMFLVKAYVAEARPA